jgi:hypothetical protein
MLNKLNISLSSELRAGSLRLLVTVLRGGMGSTGIKVNITAPRLEHHRPVNESSAIERGKRLLQFPKRLQDELMSRNPKFYGLFTAESAGFRHQHDGDYHMANTHQKIGILHREETLALIALMTRLGYTSRRGERGNANVVFIHNAAWDLLQEFLGFCERLSHIEYWFFAYGAYHALHPKHWEIRAVFKRGNFFIVLVTYKFEMVCS